MRLSVAPPSTKIFVTKSSPSSALRLFFSSQLAIAERSSSSTAFEAAFLLKRSVPGAIHLHTANHVNDIAHFAGRGGAIVQFGKILGFESRLARFGGKSFSCSHYLEIEILLLDCCCGVHPKWITSSCYRRDRQTYASAQTHRACGRPCFPSRKQG